jgi:hypothetical protein
MTAETYHNNTKAVTATSWAVGLPGVDAELAYRVYSLPSTLPPPLTFMLNESRNATVHFILF